MNSESGAQADDFDETVIPIKDIAQAQYAAEAYKREYRRILGSRVIKIWLKARAAIGRPYEIIDFALPSLKESVECIESVDADASLTVKLPPVLALSPMTQEFEEKLPLLLDIICDSNGASYYAKAHINAGIITDEYMFNYYRDALNFFYISPLNYKQLIDSNNLDFILFVSCWHGIGDGRDYNSPAKRQIVERIFDYARDRGLKTIFQTIEDPTNYEVFLGIAKHADYIFTSDSRMIDRYKADTGNDQVYSLEYGVNPSIHNPIGMMAKHAIRENCLEDSVFFAGSWYNRYPVRCDDCEAIFDAVLDRSCKNLIIADRNSALPISKREPYLFPPKYEPYLIHALNHLLLQKAHKLFDWSISLSTVKDSPTMCAMRVYELQALGCPIISNYTLSISEKFPGIFMVPSASEINNILRGYSEEEMLSMRIRSIRTLLTGNTVYDRLNYMFEKTNIKYLFEKKNVVVCARQLTESLKRQIENQAYDVITVLEYDKISKVAGDYFILIEGDVLADRNYILDMVNAFKYVDVAYVNYGPKGCICASTYNYVYGTARQTNTMFDLTQILLSQISNQEYLKKLKGFEISQENWGRKTSHNKKLGVIVPVYNNGRYLVQRCVQSLLRSTIFNVMQIYLIDDGSSDTDTLNDIEWIESTYDNVTVYRFTDGGSGSASRPRNKGLEICTEPYVTYLDPDNEAINNGYAELLRIVENTGVDFAVGTILKVCAPDYIPIELSPSYPEGVNDNPRQTLLRAKFKAQSVQACVVKKSFLVNNNIRNVCGAIGQDTLFFYEMMLKAKAFYCLKTPIHIYYAERAGSAVNGIDESFFEKSLLLETNQVRVLRECDALEDYIKIKLDTFLNGWYRVKLELAKQDAVDYGNLVIDLIEKLYLHEDSNPMFVDLHGMKTEDLYGGAFPLKHTLESADLLLSGKMRVIHWIEEDVDYSIDTFDWNGEYTESPTTFQLFLQALNPVAYLVGAYHATGKACYFDLALTLYRQWCNYEASTPRLENEYLWDQHAAALRAENILALLLVGAESNLLSIEDICSIVVQLGKHGRYHASSANYLERENHGVFQDRSLLYLGLALGVDSWVELAKKRVAEQWTALFDKDMVGAENSFAYQRIDKNLFLDIAYIMNKYDLQQGVLLEEAIERAEEFMGYALMPNGVCPPYGDTYRDDYSSCSYLNEDGALAYSSRKGLVGKAPENLFAVYTNAGYYFGREFWQCDSHQANFSDSAWTMFRSGYTSITHRQADDNSMMYYINGQEVLTDSGVYNYMFRDPMRRYVRSALAHNMVVVDSCSYDFLRADNTDLAGFCHVQTNISDNINYVVGYNSLYYGVIWFRHFIHAGRRVVIFDEVYSKNDHRYSQLFHTGPNVQARSANSTTIEYLGSDATVLAQLIQLDCGYRLSQTLHHGDESTVHKLVPFGIIGGGFNEILYTSTVEFGIESANARWLTIIESPADSATNTPCQFDLDTRVLTIPTHDELVDIELVSFKPEDYAPSPLYSMDCFSIQKSEDAGVFTFEYTQALPDCVELAWYIQGAKGKKTYFKQLYSSDRTFSFDFNSLNESEAVVRAFLLNTQTKAKASQIICSVNKNEDSNTWMASYWPDWDEGWRDWFGGTSVPSSAHSNN